MKTLVVYYSRSGTTQRLAARLATLLGADVEEIVDTRDRSGVVGWIRSIWETRRRATTTLRPSRRDPADYDVVVIGTPVWDASVSVPVRTWIVAHLEALPRVAFFCTYGGRGAARAFAQMETLAGSRPLAVLPVRAAKERASATLVACRAFASAIEGVPEVSGRHAASSPS